MISGGLLSFSRFFPVRGGWAPIGLLLCLAILPPAADFSFAADLLVVSASEQLALADLLFDRAEYDAAVVEYRRFRHFFGDHPRAAYADFRTGLSLFLDREVEKALPLFESLAVDDKDRTWNLEALLMVSRCLAALGRTDQAVGVLTERLAATTDSDAADRIRYQISWLYLEAGPILDVPAVDRAAAALDAISRDGRERYRVDDLTESLRDLRNDPDAFLLSGKNPTLAGALALFPGAGYLYCGRYHDALMSFLFIGGLAVAAYECFTDDLEAMGAVIGLVGCGFYAGSVYGSVSAAHKDNRARSREFLDRLRELRVDALPTVEGDGAVVRVRLPF